MPLARNQRPKQALEHLEKAVALRPSDSSAQFQFSAVLRAAGDNQRAIEIARKFQESKSEEFKLNQLAAKSIIGCSPPAAEGTGYEYANVCFRKSRRSRTDKSFVPDHVENARLHGVGHFVHVVQKNGPFGAAVDFPVRAIQPSTIDRFRTA